jgi:tetratricopeptide (TPR) repeat protein
MNWAAIGTATESIGAISVAAAIPKFKQAIAYDSSFALAHAGLAYAWLLMPEYSASVGRGITREKSEEAAARSLELDPDLPEGLAVMAWNHLIGRYDWVEAENLLRKALEVQANNSDALHWFSHVLSWQGLHEEAIKIAERAVESDPFSQLVKMNLSYILTDARQFERATLVRGEVSGFTPQNMLPTLELQPDYPVIWHNM